MLKNYLKIATRSLLKQKGLASINILGLSIGLACFSLFLLYSVNEFNFDRFHSDADRIYRAYRWSEAMNGRDAEGDTQLPMPFAEAIKDEFPDVEEAVRLRWGWRPQFYKLNEEVSRQSIAYADPAFFQLFNFPIIYGDSENPLGNLENLVLTKSKAEEIFGETNPVGRTIEFQIDGEFTTFTVAAVTEDMPSNSSIGFGVLGSFEFFKNRTENGIHHRDNGQWQSSSFMTFVKLREGSGLATDADRLLAFRQKYYPEEEEKLREKGQWEGEGAPITYRFQPLREMHTDTHIGWGNTISAKNIWTLLAIAFGVLLIACINFTTLAIGRSAGRATEVGVRKVIGGNKRQLVYQFLSESMLLAVLSTVIGVALAQLLLPYFNEMADRELVFSFQQFPEMGWMIVGLTVLVGLLAGSYPALVLSNFRPVEVLKKSIKLGGSNMFTRSLVTLQFVVSIGLAVSTLIILEQLDFMRSSHPGFDKENVVVVDARGTDAPNVYKRFRQKIESHPSVKGIAYSNMSMGASMGWSRRSWEHEDVVKEAFQYNVNSEYVNVLGMEIIAGRDFNQDGDDLSEPIIINEAMAEHMGWENEEAVGKQLLGYYEDTEENPLPTVVGVVKNYNFLSLTEEVKPMMLINQSELTPHRISIRIQPGNPEEILAHMEEAWKGSVYNGYPFTYSFLDDDLDRFYKSEERFSHIIGWAGGVSIFLACLGLFGLAALAAVNRTKEIGIRKVLGASVSGITSMLSKDFLKLVGIAVLISSPLAWYFMKDWLNGFAFRIDFPWWYFAVAGIGAIALAFFTVGVQGLKAALANPVKSLRSE